MNNTAKQVESHMVKFKRGTPQSLKQCIKNAVEDIGRLPGMDPELIIKLHLREFFANEVNAAAMTDMDLISFFHRVFRR